MFLYSELAAARSHEVALREIDGLRLLAHAHPRRRTGGHDVARLQGHEGTQIGDELRHGKNHVARIAVLVSPSVHLEPEIDILRIGDLIGSHEPGADRTESVATFALVPGAAAIVLILALGEIVYQHVASHMRERA